MMIIGQGTSSVTTTASSETRFIKYIIQTSGIEFFELGSNLPLTLADGETFSTTSGHLSLMSLPASPKDAFYNISLSVSADDIMFNLQHAEPFAHRAGTFLQDLDITFTQSRTGGELQVAGGLKLCLFGRPDIVLQLKPKLTPAGIVFKPAESQTGSIDIPQLGRLAIDIDTLVVGRDEQTLDDLQALYTFDESAKGIFFDSAGSDPVIHWQADGTDITSVSGGISIGSAGLSHKTVLESVEGGQKITGAAKSSQALGIAAWVKPSKIETDKNLPARIVSLSKNPDSRNFTLGQDIDRDGQNRYIVRLRRDSNHKNGTPPLISKPQEFPKNDADYVVFSRSNGADDPGKIYINGVDATDLDSADPGLAGDFDDWDNDYSLLLGNEKTKNRPWNGEIHRLALYNRALSEDEIKFSYLPRITLQATLTLDNVPTPFNTPLPVTVDLDTNQLRVDQPGLAISPSLQFDRVTFTWQQNDSSDIQLLSGQVEATLWDHSLTFDASLTAEEFKLTLSDNAEQKLTLHEPDAFSALGEIRLTQLTIQAERTTDTPGWTFGSDGQVDFAVIPEPLTGPFPLDFFLDDGKLWFSISPDTPLPLVEGLQFDRASLRFVRETSGWRVESDLRDERGGISLPLFGNTVALTAQLVPAESGSTGKVLTLTRTADDVGERIGKLNLSRFSLKGNPDSLEVLWTFAMEGKLPLGEAAQGNEAGVLDFNGLDFSTSDGKITGSRSNIPQSRILQGKFSLQYRSDVIYNGDLRLTGERFLSTGQLNLFQSWSMLQVKGEPDIEIAADGQVSFARIPAQIVLPESVILNPTLGLDNGRLALRGLWLGQDKPQDFFVREQHETIYLNGITQLSMPFSLNLPALVDDSSGARLAPATQIAERMTINMDAAFQSAGFLAVLNASFSYADAEKTNQTIVLPERRIYNAPATQNSLLGNILVQLRDSAAELFKLQGRHSADYFVTSPTGAQPQIFYSGTGEPEAEIPSELPAIFTSDVEIVSGNSIFALTQTNNRCELMLNLDGKDQSEIRSDYDDLMSQLAGSELRSARAAALLQRRIAERLTLDYDNLLYYYYGWDVDKGRIDLHAGMRLRIDLQNYQFVQASDPSARRGFVGSGSFYVSVNSYNHPLANGSHAQLLGFDPFLSRLQVNGDVDITNTGAGSPFDLLKDDFRKAFYRMFFPKQPLAGASAERSVTIIGADSLQELADASESFEATGSSSAASFFFRGKAVVVPEIQVYIGRQPRYVAVGTTFRQLIEMTDDIPSAGLPGQDLRAFAGAARPLRLVHDGVNSEPGYRFINLGDSADSGRRDLLDLPLVKGDRFCF